MLRKLKTLFQKLSQLKEIPNLGDVFKTLSQAREIFYNTY